MNKGRIVGRCSVFGISLVGVWLLLVGVPVAALGEHHQRVLNEGQEVEMPDDLFVSGTTRLSDNGKKALDRLAADLRAVQRELVIEWLEGSEAEKAEGNKPRLPGII